MIRQEYLDYIAGFSNLNPYELEHMSEKIYVQMEKVLSNRPGGHEEEVQFSTSDIKDIVILMPNLHRKGWQCRSTADKGVIMSTARECCATHHAIRVS